ncbi:1-acyl-sn-glycerol-3-phosphate acyltransferase [Laspinema sp. D1]|uniref:1-acyl-sn-glycerol-3-phosphate acyltransferase n=1 Tax=Laspinema palackyanum TaxID=3231601 RepID=UPI00348AF31E|nr:1-acyl-sn-glycerol-3-phosphate acyltransferase [Laspinema sp. D2b]
MIKSIDGAHPPLEFIPPNFNPLVLQVAKLVMPLWRKFRTPITQIQAENVEQLVELYQQFQGEKVRFLMAFRHPSTYDPFPIAHLIWQEVPQLARSKNMALASPMHFHFMYDRGIPLWAGKWLESLLPKLGGTPIVRGKIDRQGLRSARELFAKGQFPLAASPEGGTNGHNEIISPLEPGIAQLAFWCMEDLQKENRGDRVAILPIGIRYKYEKEEWDAVAALLTQMELDCGLSSLPIPGEPQHEAFTPSLASLYPRLIRLGQHLLSLMEDFYRRFYHRTLPDTAGETNDLTTRLPALLDMALQVAEEYFKLPSKGTVIDRCRRLEQAGWDRIYREDIENIEALSPLERGLADRVAEEANLRMWHMRLVECFVAVTGQYVREKPTFERFAETTLLVWDTIARIKGERPASRPELGKQSVQLTIGEPIWVSDRYDSYKTSRRSAIADLTQDLRSALEQTIAG